MVASCIVFLPNFVEHGRPSKRLEWTCGATNHKRAHAAKPINSTRARVYKIHARVCVNSRARVFKSTHVCPMQEALENGGRSRSEGFQSAALVPGSFHGDRQAPMKCMHYMCAGAHV